MNDSKSPKPNMGKILNLAGMLTFFTVSWIIVQNMTEQKATNDPVGAAFTGSLDSLRTYLNEGGNIAVKSPMDNSSLLLVAGIQGHTPVGRFLIERGIDINSQNTNGDTALHTAAFFGQEAYVKMLVDYGAATEIPNNAGETPLDVVSSKWSADLESSYLFLEGLLKIDLQLEEIKKSRVQCSDLILQKMNTNSQTLINQ
jgi:hypothetical protein